MKSIISILLTFFFVNAIYSPVCAITVNAGRQIPIAVDYTTTSKQTRTGDLIFGHVKNDIIVNKKIVIEEGATATMNVASAHKARRWGAAGEIIIINGTVQDVSGTDRPVKIDYEVKGEDKDWVKVTAGLCISTIILIPFGLLALIKGDEAKLQPSNIINAELINDFSL